MMDCDFEPWDVIGPLGSDQMPEEAVEEGDLGGEDFVAGGVEGEPLGAVDLWDFDFATGAGWPLDGRGIADEVGGVEIAFQGPGGDDFAAELLDVTEGQVEVWSAGRGHEAGFFAEFASGGFEDVFSGDDVAFGDGPGAEVAVGPEGSAGVGEQDLRTRAVVAAVKEESGAVFGGPRMVSGRLQGGAAG